MYHRFFFFCSLWLNFTFLADLIFIRIVQLQMNDKNFYYTLINKNIPASKCHFVVTKKEKKNRAFEQPTVINFIYTFIHIHFQRLFFSHSNILLIYLYSFVQFQIFVVFFFSLFFSKFCSDEYAHNGQIVIKINHPKKLISNHMFSKCEN